MYGIALLSPDMNPAHQEQVYIGSMSSLSIG